MERHFTGHRYRFAFLFSAALVLGFCLNGGFAQDAPKEDSIQTPTSVNTPYYWDPASNKLSSLAEETRHKTSIQGVLELKNGRSALRVSVAHPEFVLFTPDATKFKLYLLSPSKDKRELQLMGVVTDAAKQGAKAAVVGAAAGAAAATVGAAVPVSGLAELFMPRNTVILTLQRREIPLTITGACRNTCYILRPELPLRTGEYLFTRLGSDELFTFGVDALSVAPELDETPTPAASALPAADQPVGIPQYFDPVTKIAAFLEKEAATIEVSPAGLAELQGSRAVFRIASTDKPEFMIRGTSGTRLRLYQFQTETDKRRLAIAKARLASKLLPGLVSNTEPTLFGSEIRLSTVAVCGWDCTRIAPKVPLTPGEYAVTLHGDDELAFDFFTFGIDAAPAGGTHEVLETQFVKIQPGEFLMGCSMGDSQCDEDEKPAHRVRITKAFEIGKYEVTQAQWQSMVGYNASFFKGADLPVENVTWNEVQLFLDRMNARRDGYHYRLPTEAEWEYAARAGSGQALAASLDRIAWYGNNAGREVLDADAIFKKDPTGYFRRLQDNGNQSHAVGQKQPNDWGLYDTQGNVREWTQAAYNDKYYSNSPESDPVGPASGKRRVIRGTGWTTSAINARVSIRDSAEATWRGSFVGFRYVREAIQ